MCYSRGAVRSRLRHVPAAAALLTLAAVSWHHAGSPRLIPDAGPRPDLPSLLDVTDAYLPSLAPYRQTGFVSQVPLKFVADYTISYPKDVAVVGLP